MLYCRAIPHYDDEGEDWDESINADNPDNFQGGKEEEVFYRR